MGGALHPGIARAGASFELERLELDEGRLVVRGCWSGVRGVRFVRPGLVVDGRRVLATLEHKPWAAGTDGGWIAAFPWKRGLDMAGVSLVVAPSVEVPLDREAAVPSSETADGLVSAPLAVVEEPLRDELAGIEHQLDAMHAELREARAHAAEREERCRELEQAVAHERQAADAAQDADDEFVRSHAMAVLDRDRAMAQHAAAVGDREAAVRARKRMERQRDDAVAAAEAAEARRSEALAERDEARKQRDELLLAHQALQAQVKREWVQEAAPAAVPERSADPGREQPIGVRTIPAARKVAGSLHRSQREREHVVTRWDMWAVRILGSIAALAFISLLLMILKAFFVF